MMNKKKRSTLIQNYLSVDLSSFYGLLKISGHQAKSFLQGQLTCHMDEVTATHPLLAANCNPQGRIISLFQIFLLANDYYLLMPRDLIPIALSALKKYAIFFKVSLEDLSEQFFYSGCDAQYLEQLTEKPFMVLKHPVDTQRFILVLTNKPSLTTSLSTWREFDIDASFPHVFADTSGMFLPHDINLLALNAISFNKGCYTGQEIIARMHYKGKIKNQLYRTMIATTTLKRGSDIFTLHHESSHTVGNIVDFITLEKHCKALVVLNENDLHSALFLHSEASKESTLTFF